MESHSQADDIITLPNDSQSGTQATTSSHLLVECPGICKRRAALDSIKLASDGRSRAIWTCSSCSQFKKKQIKIRWYNLVCVQCTHTHGETCLIQNCTSNCPTKQALEKRKELGPGKAKATPKVDRTFKRARRLIERLKHKELRQRLQVLKAAWRLGNGGEPQPWFKLAGSKKVLISKLHSGFAAFAAKPSVALPVGFQDALAEKFDIGNNMTRLGMEGKARQGAKDFKDWKAKDWKDWKAQKFAMHFKRIFKYNDEIYQDVRNFCNTFPGLQQSGSNGAANSTARAHVINTEFPKSAYLVVPGHSNNRYIPQNWKNGAQDLGDLKGTAYILGRRMKPTGKHLLLVSQKELRRKARSAILLTKQKKGLKTNSTGEQTGVAKSHIRRKRPAKVQERRQNSTSVARANC